MTCAACLIQVCLVLLAHAAARQVPEGSMVQAGDAGPTASYVAQAPPDHHQHHQEAGHESAQAPVAPALSEAAKAGSNEPKQGQ